VGIGTGLTDEEKAEAARIRRAKLVAQDPLYTQRLMGNTASNVVHQPITQQQVFQTQQIQQQVFLAKDRLAVVKVPIDAFFQC
jgi:hypothetical protein